MTKKISFFCLAIFLFSLASSYGQRVLIDIGADANYGGTLTTNPNLNGNYWNNMTDARPGIRIANAINTGNQQTGINIEVINRVDGTYSTSSSGLGNGNTVGVVGDYPASSTTDHALVHSSATAGRWRVSGLIAASTYNIKFWGARSNTTASRSIEIKRADETAWQTYNATANTNYSNACVFTIAGKTQMDFDIRTKAGSDFSAINVIDISYGSQGSGSNPVNLPPVALAGADTTIQLPVDSILLKGCLSYDPENAPLRYKWLQLSGPACQLVGDTLCAAKVKNMLAGIYRFELAVKDTAGLIRKDTVQINVNAIITTNWPPPVTALCNLPYKIVVVGSSTAYGTGSNPIDSSWVKKYKAYMLQNGQQVTLVNLATPGLTSWDVSPTGTYTPFPFTIDTARNITKALTYQPDAIILSLPSNDVARGVPVDTIHRNYSRIVALADAQHIPVWVTTTQPRNGLSPAENILQMDLRDWINTSYGTKAVDFWNTVANADGTINEFYSFGDGVHLNNYGHHVLFTRMIQEKLWDSVCLRRVPNFPPVARAGNDTLINGNNTSFLLNGTNSYDPEGTNIQFNWRLISQQNCSISGTNTVRPQFSASAAGSFLVELTITDAAGLTGKDSISINLIAANILPVANAGPDQAIVMPNHIVNLNGSGSADPDGTIVSYRWRKLSSGSSVSITDSTAVQTTVNFSGEGVYVFELKVTDNRGGITRDTATVAITTVLNRPPVALAGADQSITLPVNHVFLDGRASYDPEGSSMSYLWTKTSGGAVVILNEGSDTTTVNFPAAGTYTFRLDVTDNEGLGGTDLDGPYRER